MFQEVLRIKPTLDPAATKQMESNLSGRFARVAKRFGSGLKSLLKGTALVVTAQALSRLLNPIETLEEKIKGLLGSSAEIQDLADRFSTTPGEIKKLQDVAASMGVNPDQLNELMTKFATAVETARKELANPFLERSEATPIVQGFAKETDLAKSFQMFMKQVQALEGTGGRDVFLSDVEKRKAAERAATGEKLSEEERQRLIKEGLLKVETAADTRRMIEEAIFGQAQFGASKRFLNADVSAQAAKIKEPKTETLTAALNKTAGLADQQRALQVQRDTQDFLNAAGGMNASMIASMEAAQRAEADRVTKQLGSYADLRRAADGIEVVKSALVDLTNITAKGVGYVGDFMSKWKGVQESGWYRRIFGGGGK